jgi:hypothetical protein
MRAQFLVVGGCVFGAVLLANNRNSYAAWTAGPPATYFIDESTDFTVPGSLCQNTDVNDITSSLRTALNGDGWSGTRFVNSTAWPQDLKESSFNPSAWFDDVYADNKALSVYAGHGNVDSLQYGSTHAGDCGVTISTQMRMGRLDGGKNRVFMYLASCTGTHGSHSTTIFQSGSGQHLAYHNSPNIEDNQPRDMYNATWNSSNRTAWVNIMDDRPGTGWNSPVVYTRNSDPDLALWYHLNARLALENHHQMGQPFLNYYYVTLVNNGGC